MHAEPEIRRLRRGEPAAHVGRSIRFVAQLAADDPDAIDDLDGVHPDAARLVDDTVGDVEELDDFAVQAGLLGQLAQDRIGR